MKTAIVEGIARIECQFGTFIITRFPREGENFYIGFSEGENGLTWSEKDYDFCYPAPLILHFNCPHLIKEFTHKTKFRVKSPQAEPTAVYPVSLD